MPFLPVPPRRANLLTLSSLLPDRARASIAGWFFRQGEANRPPDAGRREAGEPGMQSFDLERLARQAAESVRRTAQGKGVALRVEFAGSAERRAIGDALGVRRVLLYLLSNAMRFTHRGTVAVRVCMVAADDGLRRVRIEVADTGVGVPIEAAVRLFQPFDQADRSAAGRSGGTGVGLVLARELVERMNGRIGVRSQPGRGSTFWFEVPLRRATRGAAVVRVRPWEGRQRTRPPRDVAPHCAS